MNHIHWSLFLQLIAVSSWAQDDARAERTYQENVFAISRQEGLHMILFDTTVWDSLVNGTKYISCQLATKCAVPVFIQISSKSSGCRGGIGFSCSIFDRQMHEAVEPALVDHDNRFSAALIRKLPGGSIALTLLDRIDWVSLQNENHIAAGDE